MGVIVLGVRPSEQPIVLEEAEKVWFGLRMEWIGWNGSRFVLSNPQLGVFASPGEIEGFGPPEYFEWVQDSPATPGQYFRGAKAKPRSIFIPVAISHPGGSIAFEALYRRFFDTVKRDRYGTLRLTTPGGVIREIQARTTGKPPTYGLDPFRKGYHGYGWELVADDPYWSGNTIRQTFVSGSSVDFYTGGGDTLATISDGQSFGTAAVSNPGDIDAWPIWTVVGGATTTVTMGVGSELVSVPFAVAAGKALRINTDPRDRQAWYGDWDATTEQLTGTLTDRTADLGTSTQFARIPPGSEVALAVALGGTGSVRVDVTPLYERAF
jgi:hypothetical protein